MIGNSHSEAEPEEQASSLTFDGFVDQGELARRLGVHVRTVRRMVARGELPSPCMGAGGRPRWLWSYVVDFCRAAHERESSITRRMRSKLK
jgi:excisionase family DNA binding protein